MGNQKMQAQLNNTITGNMGNYNSLGAPRESIDHRGKSGAMTEKTPNSALNTRNWRNKSIDAAPENADHQYAYQASKRAGSTAVGERHHNQSIAMGKNQNLNGTTDYSYNIGPTSA